MRIGLDQSFDLSVPLTIRVAVDGSAVYDIACFGVDAAGRLSDDRYMVFYNQTKTPGGEIDMQQTPQGTIFTCALTRLPSSIVKLVFTISIDGTATMTSLRSCVIAVEQLGAEPISLPLTGADFSKERAIVAVEIYQKNGWRMAAVASGFNGGLGDLLRAYGGEEVQPAAQNPIIAPPVLEDLGAPAAGAAQNNPPAGKKISLEKKLQSAPKLISLAKPIQIVLEKQKLQDTTARVALVLDMSGSMFQRYQDGTVQSIVNKALPLALQFDDDGELDFWLYGSKPQRMPAVTLQNYSSAVPMPFTQTMFDLGYGNNEPEVMKEVIKEYRDTKIPAYVIFITDGDISLGRAIQSLLMQSSTMPIFWQFVGVGGKDYGVLEQLDTMSGRHVDNAGFFALDDFKRVPNDVLYNRLLSEFPQWLNAIRADSTFSQIR